MSDNREIVTEDIHHPLPFSKQGRTIDYETNDTWETFEVCFNVHKQDSAQMHLQIYDHNVELVDQSIHDTIRMHRS